MRKVEIIVEIATTGVTSKFTPEFLVIAKQMLHPCDKTPLLTDTSQIIVLSENSSDFFMVGHT